MGTFRIAVAVGIATVSGVMAMAGTGGGSLVRASLFGGDQVDVITDVVVLKNKTVAVCGYTDSELPVPLGGWRSERIGGRDGFAAILTPDLKTVLYFTYIGGPQQDEARGLAEDPTGGIVVVGETNSPEFPTTSGVFGQVYSTGKDGFIIRFNTTLSDYTKSSFINGNKDEYVTDVAVDEYGSIYVCGSTTSNLNFPLNNGYRKEHQGGRDAFVLRTNPGAMSLAFSTYFGGSTDDEYQAMAILNDGSVALTGWTSSADFYVYPEPPENPWTWPLPEKPYDGSYNGGSRDVILTVISGDGSKVSSSTFFGGSKEDEATAIDYNSRGNIIVFGNTASQDLTTLVAGQASNAGGKDVFIASFDSQGRSLLGCTYFGGLGNESVSDVQEVTSDVYNIVGTTTSRNIEGKGAGSSTKLVGASDLYVARIGIGSYGYFSTINWPDVETPSAIALDANSDVYIAGSTLSRTITWDRGSAERTGGATVPDGFIAKLAFGTLMLDNPRPTDKICAGSKVQVSWTTADVSTSEKFKIEISSDGEQWDEVVKDVVARNYTWIVPPTLDVSKKYSVRVVSARDHASATDGPVTITPAAMIAMQPQAVKELCVGEPFELSVDATGSDLKYQWRKNGDPISGKTAPVLQIASASAGDAAGYDCVISSTCGSVTTLKSQVSIGVLPVITQQPTDVSVEQGKPATFHVVANSVAPTYKWQHDGNDIPNAVESEYNLVSVSANDAGNYRCIVTAACGSTTSSDATLIVTPTTGVDDDMLNASMSVSPVPAADVLTVHGISTPTTLRIVNTFGEAVRSIDAHDIDMTTGQLRLDVSALSSGTYTLLAGAHAVRFAIAR